MDEELYEHAQEWRSWSGYSEQERIAAEFAHRFGTEHTKLRDDEDFWERMGRMLRTLDIGQTCTLTLPSRA